MLDPATRDPKVDTSELVWLQFSWIYFLFITELTAWLMLRRHSWRVLIALSLPFFVLLLHVQAASLSPYIESVTLPIQAYLLPYFVMLGLAWYTAHDNQRMPKDYSEVFD